MPEPVSTANNGSLRLTLNLPKGWNTLSMAIARGQGQRLLSVQLSIAPADWSSALIESGRLEEATRLIQKSLERMPNDPTLLQTAARLHRRIGVQLRERNQDEAARSHEGEACSLYAKLIAQLPYEGSLVAEFREYLRSLNSRHSWRVLNPMTLKSEGGTTLVRLPDGSILASGTNPEKDTYIIVATTETNAITGIRLEVLADRSLPSMGPGRHAGGNFHLTAIAMSSASPDEPSSSQAVAFSRAIATYTRRPDQDTTLQDGPRGAIDGTHQTRWDIWPQVGKTNVAYFEPKQPVSGRNPKILTLRLHFRDPVYKQVNLGRFRLSVTSDPYPLAIERWQAADDLIGLAGTYYAGGDFRRAMDLLEANTAPGGGDVQTWLALALCSAQVGRLPEARVWYDRALSWLRIHPADDDGIKELALLAMTRIEGLSAAEAESKLKSL